jgi:co-chaperonin GroES (HSP10)
MTNTESVVSIRREPVTPDEIRDDILQRLGDLSCFEVFGNRVMVAVYVRPQRTAGGIYLTDNSRDEDEYQGKAALVIKKGPISFKNEPNLDFHGQDVQPGDWVLVRASDRRNFKYKDVLCAHVEDIRIEQKISDPRDYY